MVGLDRTIRINTIVRVLVRSSRSMTGAGESTSTWTGIAQQDLVLLLTFSDLGPQVAAREIVGTSHRIGHAASARMCTYRSDLPSKPMPGSSGNVTMLFSTAVPSGNPPYG